MKTKHKIILGISALLALVGGSLSFIDQRQAVGATPALAPYQGGTGTSSVNASDVGKYLKVSNNSPFTFTFDSPSAGSASNQTHWATDTGSTIIPNGGGGILVLSSSTIQTLGVTTGTTTNATSTTLNVSGDFTVTNTGTSSFSGGIKILNSAHLFTHGIIADGSDGLHFNTGNSTIVATLGAGNTSNALFYGGVNIDGATRLATSLTGLLKANSGAVTTATAGTDYLASYDAWTHLSTSISATTSGIMSTASSTFQYFNSASSTLGSLLLTAGTSTNFFSTDGTFTRLTVTNGTATNFFATNASSTGATTTDLRVGDQLTGNLFSLTAGTSTSFFATQAMFTSASSTAASTTNMWSSRLAATNAVFTNSTSTYHFSTNASSTKSTTTSLYVGNQSVFKGFANFVDAIFTGSLQIPNGTAPTVDATGEIAVDTTSGQLKAYDGTEIDVYLPIFHKNLYLQASTTDEYGLNYTSATTTYWVFFPQAVTLNEIDCLASTTASGLVRMGDGTNWTTTAFCKPTTPGSATSLSNNTFTANEPIAFQIGSTTTTDPTTIFVTATFKLTPD